MRLVEGGDQILDGATVVAAQRHRQLERLAAIAQRRRALEPARRRIDAVAVERARRRLRQRQERAGDLGRRQARARRARSHGGDEVVRDVGGERAVRAQQARRRRHQDARHAELARHGAGVQRAGAAERQQREARRIVPALDGDDLDRARHHRRRDGEQILGRLLDADAEPLAPAAPSAARARSSDSGMAPPSRPAGGSRPSTRLASVTVGARAAAVVGRRPRLGAGRLGPDLERAALVDARDRAAAGTDGVDRQHRQLQHAAGDGRLVGERHLPAGDERHVGRGAAHVEA